MFPRHIWDHSKPHTFLFLSSTSSTRIYFTAGYCRQKKSLRMRTVLVSIPELVISQGSTWCYLRLSLPVVKSGSRHQNTFIAQVQAVHKPRQPGRGIWSDQTSRPRWKLQLPRETPGDWVSHPTTSSTLYHPITKGITESNFWTQRRPVHVGTEDRSSPPFLKSEKQCPDPHTHRAYTPLSL